jgi:hypothetical protein
MSGSSSIRLGDDQIRSDKSVLDKALNHELYFDAVTSASSLSGGIARPGIARAYFGTRASLATPNSADSEGRLVVSTDLESLHYLNASSHSTLVFGRLPWGAKAAGPVPTGSASSSAITWQGETFDVGAMFSAGSTRINLTSAGSGRYLINAHYQFLESVHSGSYRRMSVFRNGTINLASASASTLQAGPIDLNVSTVESSSASTWFYEVFVAHDAGVTLGSSDVTGSFSVQRL